MARTISGVQAPSLVLVAADDPVLIATDTFVNDTPALPGFVATAIGTPWQIDNSGTVLGAGYAFVLLSGGTLTNEAAGLSGAMVAVAPDTMIANQGSIAAATEAVWLTAGGTVTNGSTANAAATIIGGVAAVLAGDGSTVTNSGSLFGANGFGVLATGSIALSNSGQISGGQTGAYLAGASANVGNSGTILGGGVAGAWLAGGGTLANSGTIAGPLVGLADAGGAAIVNSGLIAGDFGALLLAGGTLTNSGTIGGAIGVLASANGAAVTDLVIDSGLIASAYGPSGIAVQFLDSNATLRLTQGAILYGRVLGDGDSTLDLAPAPAAGSPGAIGGLGSTVTGFASVTVEGGADWSLSGPNTLAAGQSLTLAGTLGLAAGAALAVAAAPGGAGTLDLGGTGSQTAVFGGQTAGGTLALALRDIGIGDRIDVGSVTASGTLAARLGVLQAGIASAAVVDGTGTVLFTLASAGLAGSGIALAAGTDPANGDVSLLAMASSTATASVSAALSDITGPAGGTLTRDPAVAGIIAAPAGIAGFTASLDGGAATSILGDVTGAGAFALNAAAMAQIAGGALADGTHDLHLAVTDPAGHIGTVDVAFTLQASAPALAFDVASAFTAGDAAGTTGSGTVTLMGTTAANSVVKLAATGQTATADATGSFALPGVALAQGANALTLTATDPAGVTATQLGTITFAPGASNAPLLYWDQQAQLGVQHNASDPYSASRAYAIEAVTVMDTLNAIRGAAGYYVSLQAPAGISAAAAVDGAAAEALSSIFPGQTATFASALAQSLASLPAGAVTDQSVAFGRAVADAVAARRAGDGYNVIGTFNGPTGVGLWQPTRPGFLPALDSNWGNTTPFVMNGPSQFLPAPPPAIDSPAYEAALAQDAALGQNTSTVRTADQTQIAKFWNDPPGSFTPSGQWNTVLQNVATQDTLDLYDSAVMFADVNLAMADGSMVGSYTKYYYDLWRPVTAIDTGDTVNPANPNWVPLLVTPNFPSYSSGHAIFSQTAATILDTIVGPTSFSLTSSSLAGVTRSFTGFDQAAYEAAISRIYGGIHYLFDSTTGLVQGAQIGAYDLSVEQQTTLDRGPFLSLDQAGPFVVTTGSLALSGYAFDNVAPLTVLTATLDGQTTDTVNLTSAGRWSFDVSQFGTLAAGTHRLHLSTTDQSGTTGTLDIGFGVAAAAVTAAITPATLGTQATPTAFLTPPVAAADAASAGTAAAILANIPTPAPASPIAASVSVETGTSSMFAGSTATASDLFTLPTPPDHTAASGLI